LNLTPNKYGYLVVNTKDLHKHYCHNLGSDISYKLFRKVLESIFKKVWDKLFNDLYRYKPIPGFGAIYIAERPTKDWYYGYENGERVRKMNIHTNGRSFKIRWDRHMLRRRHLSLYSFFPVRGSKEEGIGKRGLAGHIKERAADPYKKDFRAYQI